MRPPELFVRFNLFELDCKRTEDSGGDEPYMWVLGFKVDADTIGPPPAGSLIPRLGVQIFEGPPHFRHLVGAGSVTAPRLLPIPPALGVRDFTLRPARLPLAGWFPGLAGLIAVLWDQDAFDPETSEEAYRAFHAEFGPALSDELTSLLNGGYDFQLSRDANNQVVPGLEALDVPTRLARLRIAEVRGRALKGMKDAIVPRLKNRIMNEITPGLDEIIDPDDLLGAETQVYMGDELGINNFSLRFTGDDADYTARGQATARRVRAANLEAVITKVEREMDYAERLYLQVCVNPPQEYVAFAFRQTVTTRYELRNVGPNPPSEVRWFLDGKPLPAGDGTRQVNYEALAAYEGPPEDVLEGHYLGGPGTLRTRANGPVLEIWNEPANGVYFGEVKALFAYPGDPPLDNTFDSGYERAAPLSISAVDLAMDAQYREDVARCHQIISDIDRERFDIWYGLPFVDPGDPPPFRDVIRERVSLGRLVARVAQVVVHSPIHQ